MDETRTWQLWRTFSGTPAIMFSPQTTFSKLAVYRTRLRKLFPMPAVYAAEVEQQTTIERLGQQKPLVIVEESEVDKYISQETGYDRLRDLFTKKEDSYHPDLVMTMAVTQACAMLTFVTTSAVGAQAAREAFLRKNQHTKYKTKFLAARAHNDVVILGGIKFGLKWGLRTLIFTSLFMLTSQMISTYQNKTTVWQYTVSTALTGGLLRANLGLKGMVAGSVIGSVLGTLGGCIFYTVMVSAGETQEAKHFRRIYEQMKSKKELEILLGTSPPKEEIISLDVPHRQLS